MIAQNPLRTLLLRIMTYSKNVSNIFSSSNFHYIFNPIQNNYSDILNAPILNFNFFYINISRGNVRKIILTSNAMIYRELIQFSFSNRNCQYILFFLLILGPVFLQLRWTISLREAAKKIFSSWPGY